MSMWYQWFMPAPTMIMLRPLVLWALSANSRAMRVACSAETPVIFSCQAGV
ncbi:hypothetical protein VRRI112168_20370 [Vreelandella rituensis]